MPRSPGEWRNVFWHELQKDLQNTSNGEKRFLPASADRREAPDFDDSVNASLKKVQKKTPILFASMSVCIISSAQA